MSQVPVTISPEPMMLISRFSKVGVTETSPLTISEISWDSLLLTESEKL